VKALGGVGRVDRSPLALGKAREGEQPVAGLLQTVGDGATLQPSFADEGLALGLDQLLGLRIDHVFVTMRDFLMQPL
jgi:hypothetical protein